LRHVPPFPFKAPAQLAGPLLLMSGSDNGQSLELYSTVSTKKMLKIEKKGDFSINQSALI